MIRFSMRIIMACMAAGLSVHTVGAQSDVDSFAAGEVTEFKFSSTKIYPGTERTVWLYVPAAYIGDSEACLYVALDEIPYGDVATLDRLISAGEIPVMIGVFVSSGTVYDDIGFVRFNRSNEFDTRSDTFALFLEEELLPYVETLNAKDGRPIKLSKNPDDRMIHGNSSGAICAFTAAWTRPDLFRRVYSAIGTYVWMRGGNEYPALIRKSEPKPIRIFLQDTYDDVWNPLFGSWFEANVLMESALRFAGYDMKHEWGEGAHDGYHAARIFPDVLRWLWRDWPVPVEKGISQNDMLSVILDPDSDWTQVAKAEGNLFSDKTGRVWLMSPQGLLAVGENGLEEVNGVKMKDGDRVLAAFGESFFGTDVKGRLVRWKASRRSRFGGKVQRIEAISVRNDGSVYAATEAGEIWLAGTGGNMSVAGRQSGYARSVALFPDGRMLAATETDSHWIYNHIVNPDRSLRDSQRWYWLHNTANREADPIGNIMFDTAGNLYVATTDGVQVCDHNGRVRAILSLPSGAVSSLCFGGVDLKTLYVISGGKLYKRDMNSTGFPGDADPHDVPTQGAG